MKLQSIELHNFLSHRDTLFEPNGARLLSVVGANGAGKSSLLDGVLYSLYDAARAKTDQLVRLGQTDMSVAVTFDFAGATYRVVRGRTTKSGGKTYLELAVRDGDAWRPLTSEDIRTTQATIEQLLGLDATTFTTAAFLRQGEADTFISATPAERKRVLSQVLGLEVYALAEAWARELARDLESRTAVDRAQAERLEAEVAGERGGLDVALEQARAQLTFTLNSIDRATSERDRLEARARELDAALANTERQAADLARLEGERATVGDDWRRAQDRWTAAGQAMEEARQAIADSALVDAAAAAVPAARAAVDALVAGEAEDRRLTREITDMDRAIRDLEIPHRNALATWTAQHAAAAAKAAELEAHAKAGTSVCATCGQAIKQDAALAQLKAAREAVKALGGQPEEPISIARARAGRIRLDSRLRELAWDPGAMILARDDLTRLERTAARGEAIAAARGTIEREAAGLAEAEADKARLAAKGQAMRDQIVALQAQIDQAGPIRAERSATLASRDQAAAALQAAESQRMSLERGIAGGEAQLAALERSAAAAARIRIQLATDDLDLGRLRKLVQAFGVTGIPARIIEGVLPELAGYANELLAELRPGMTLELRAQRAKRDGKGVVEALDLVVRDPVGERPLALFSGGERMSVSLALAIGLSRLVARRAGSRIESLVVDEPDGLDRDARRSFGQALRTIAHRGDLARIVLVSHHEDLAEFGDATYQVTKGPEGSVVSQVI